MTTEEQIRAGIRRYMAENPAELSSGTPQRAACMRLGSALERLEAVAPEILAEMRGWCADCQWANAEREQIEEAPARLIVGAVARYYAGGIGGFVADFEPGEVS